LLKREAERARAAMARALGDISTHLKSAADPHVLTREHPWVAVTTAVVAGFAASIALIPTREEAAIRKLAALERARHGNGEKPRDASDKHQPTFGQTIVAELMKTVRPLLTTLLSATLTQLASAASGNSSSVETSAASVGVPETPVGGAEKVEGISSPS
jgi:hypothetical protein